MADLMPLIHRMMIGILLGIVLARPLLEWYFRDSHNPDWAAYTHSLLLQIELGAPVVAAALMISGAVLSSAPAQFLQPVLVAQLVLILALVVAILILNNPVLRRRQELARCSVNARLTASELRQMQALNRRQNVLLPVQLALILFIVLVSV